MKYYNVWGNSLDLLSDLEAIEMEVTKYLNEGWELVGPIQVTKKGLFQTMVQKGPGVCS